MHSIRADKEKKTGCTSHWENRMPWKRCQPWPRRYAMRARICGHLHEAPGVALLNETLVVNCSIGGKGGGALIDFKKGEAPQVEMLLQ